MQLNDSRSSHNVALPYSADVDDSWFDFVLGSWRGQAEAVSVGCFQHNVVSWIEDEMAWLWRWTPNLVAPAVLREQKRLGYVARVVQLPGSAVAHSHY